MKLLKLLDNSIDNRFCNLDIKGVTCNSKDVQNGYAFVCIEGTTADGHTFARKAAKAGAAIIIAERDTGLENQIIVEDTRAIYSKMCANYFGRPAESLKIIGVTGTNGKTSITYLLRSILERSGIKTGLIGTMKNMIGDEVLPAKNTTPDAYELHSLFSLMLKAGCKYVIMEVSSHALVQKRVEGLKFTAAVFTNLTQDHLDYHKTMENYLAAKKTLFTMCEKAIINADDPYSKEIVKDCECDKIYYSVIDDKADYIAREPKYKADGVTFELLGNGVIGRVKFKTPGKFSVYNALAAGVTALAIGVPFADVVESLSEASGVKGRAEVVETGRDFTVIIDYAHTPDGLVNIISMINQVKKGRLITLFGCGGDRDKSKRPLMGKVAAELSDYCVVTSDNPRSEDPMSIIEDITEGMKSSDTPYVVIENRIEAIDYCIKYAMADDIILLAGKGHETYQILKTGTICLDERKIVSDVLEHQA